MTIYSEYPKKTDETPRCDACGSPFRHPELFWRVKTTGQKACAPDCLMVLLTGKSEDQKENARQD